MINKLVALVRGQTAADTANAAANAQLVTPQADTRGNLFVRSVNLSPAGALVQPDLRDLGLFLGAGGPTHGLVTASAQSVFNSAFNEWFSAEGVVMSDGIDPTGFTGLSTAHASFVMGYNGVNFDQIRSQPDNIDGQAILGLGQLAVQNRGMLYNETGFDRQRGNTDLTLLANGIRNANTASADTINYNSRGMHVLFNITVVPGVDTITPVVEGLDPVSGNYYTLLQGPAIVSTGLTVLKLYPGIVPIANGAASDILPRVFRLNVTHSGAGNFTYSAGASLIV